jgi:hypothetical protein
MERQSIMLVLPAAIIAKPFSTGTIPKSGNRFSEDRAQTKSWTMMPLQLDQIINLARRALATCRAHVFRISKEMKKSLKHERSWQDGSEMCISPF